MRSPITSSRKPAPPQPASIEAIIKEILERKPDVQGTTVVRMVEEIFQRAPRPLSKAEVFQIVARLTNDSGRGRSISDVIQRLALTGAVRFVGKESRTSVTGVVISVPVYTRTAAE